MSEEQAKQTKTHASLFLVFFGNPVFKLNTCKRRISVKDKRLLVDLAFAIQEVIPPQFDWKSVAWSLQLMYINVLDSFCPDEPKLALKVIFK